MKISQKYLLFQKIKSIHNNEFSRCQALATKVPGMRTPIGSKKILPQRVILMLTSLLTTPTGRSSKPPSGSRELSKSQQFSRKRVKISNHPGTDTRCNAETQLSKYKADFMKEDLKLSLSHQDNSWNKLDKAERLKQVCSILLRQPTLLSWAPSISFKNLTCVVTNYKFIYPGE